MNLLHVGAFNSTNAGDTVLLNATHRLWEKMVGEIDWVRMSVWSVVDKGALEWINETDGVVIGAGGLLLRDSRPNVHTGWQWNCPINILNKINVPIYVFGIGYNRFRGQTDFPSVFSRHISLLVEKAKFFSVRNTGSKRELERYLPKDLWDKIHVQPCPSTILSKIEDYPPVELEDRVAVNIAFDRPEFRYNDGADSLIEKIEKLRDYANIVYVKHLPNDICVDERKAVLMSGKPSFHIIDFYRKTPLTIATRGHAQMIPFGVGRPVFSVVTHNKLAHFLEDIGHPEWGAEESDPDLLKKMIGAVQNISTDGIEEAQEKLWKITCANFERMGYG